MTIQRGFTIIETAIVIGILAVISVMTVLFVNPLELFKEARDAQRASDLNQIAGALEMASYAHLSLGAADSVYVSIPQDGGVCPTIEPSLVGGYLYACVAAADLRKVDGTGWIPVQFSEAIALAGQKPLLANVAEAASSPFLQLPIDPINSTEEALFYSYTVKDLKYELITRFESSKYQSKMQIDGGFDLTAYETGSDLGLWNEATGGNFAIGGGGGGGIAAGLVGHWKFDDGPGTAVADSSGNGNNGVIVHNTGTTPSWTTGKIGGGLRFYGGFEPAANYVRVPQSASINDLRPMSVTAWVKPEVLGFSSTAFFSKGYSDDSGYSPLTVQINGDIGLLGFVHDTELMDPFFWNANYSFQNGQWYHVAVVWGGETNPPGTYESPPGNWHIGDTTDMAKIYIDGDLYTAPGYWSGMGDPVSDAAYDLFIGSSYTDDWGSYPFDGIVDELRLYNRALSEAEVQEIYAL